MPQHRPIRAFLLCLPLMVLACQSEGGAGDLEPAAARPQMDPASGSSVGEVSERLEAGSYTYLRVGEAWVVTMGDGAPVGAKVSVTRIGERENFQSRRLNRTFDRLVFGIVRTL